MLVNLSEQTIKTVWKVLMTRKYHLEDMLLKAKCSSSLKDDEIYFKIKLSEVNEALQVFDEII